ncbi:hypothetical protein L2E82_30465 [Cichorium intybus]|uniref:Uncharacterized protein n=1 Tax=Cichorium intybus TaxID=13427 RepID=A0ACB9D0A7_CICIN|nr:hypothetical protein L2E82_30465 [Cichorium intybus]
MNPDIQERRELTERWETNIEVSKVKSINIEEEEVRETKDILNCKLVGEVKCYSNLALVSNLCAAEGLKENMVKYIGGFWILFDIKSEEEEEKIQNSPEIKACFKSLRRWGEEFHVQDRISWLKVEDTCNDLRQDWSYGVICIKTEIMDQINETVTMNIGKNSFKVRVSEIHGDVEGFGIKSSNSRDKFEEEEIDCREGRNQRGKGKKGDVIKHQ